MKFKSTPYNIPNFFLKILQKGVLLRRSVEIIANKIQRKNRAVVQHISPRESFLTFVWSGFVI